MIRAFRPIQQEKRSIHGNGEKPAPKKKKKKLHSIESTERRKAFAELTRTRLKGGKENRGAAGTCYLTLEEGRPPCATHGKKKKMKHIKL